MSNILDEAPPKGLRRLLTGSSCSPGSLATTPAQAAQ